MTALIDTNVVLDILLKNTAFIADSRIILELAEQKRFIGYISASAITDIFYPASVTDKDIYKALDLEWSDFEDSVQYIVGEGLSVDYIITRNIQDFTPTSIAIITPEQFLQTIGDTA